jgi:hypothetical protein
VAQRSHSPYVARDNLICQIGMTWKIGASQPPLIYPSPRSWYSIVAALCCRRVTRLGESGALAITLGQRATARRDFVGFRRHLGHDLIERDAVLAPGIEPLWKRASAPRRVEPIGER